MRVVLPVFPLVTAATMMVTTAIWVTSVTFGRLLSTIVTLPGTGNCITIIQVCTGTTSISNSALVFVAWGISPVVYLTIYPEQSEGLATKILPYFIPKLIFQL